ncbi:hypothetical protein KKHLCK_09580 [Candidatus Electrothrix laxa]
MPLSTSSLVILVSSLMIVPCGVIIKKLTRGKKTSPDQEWEDWFLGIELVFSALTSALFKALETAGFMQGPAASPANLVQPIAIEKIQRYVLFSLWILGVLLIIMLIHQRGIDWSNRSRTIKLGILADVLGVMLIVVLNLI